MTENRKSYPLNFKKQVLNILDENNGNFYKPMACVIVFGGGAVISPWAYKRELF